MKRKSFFTALCLLAGVCMAQAQQRDKYLQFGLTADYTLINDKAIGNPPLEALDGGLYIGFNNRGEKSIWGISLWGTFGFVNTARSSNLGGGSDIITPLGTYSPQAYNLSQAYRFPNYNTRIADRYAARLEGEYLRRVNRLENRWKIFVGGQMSLHTYYNQILIFTNSESNYFFHLGIAPKVHLEYPFNMLKKEYRIIGSASYDVLAVVARPSYSLPFPDDRMDNVRLASLGGYGMAQTRIGLFHRMRKGNAWEAAYRWQYDFDSHMNRVRQGMHSLSFILYINL